LREEQAKQKGNLSSFDLRCVKRKREDDLDKFSAEQRQKSQKLKGSDASYAVWIRTDPPTFSSLLVEVHDLIF